jgi:hypothetical protein
LLTSGVEAHAHGDMLPWRHNYAPGLSKIQVDFSFVVSQLELVPLQLGDANVLEAHFQDCDESLAKFN